MLTGSGSQRGIVLIMVMWILTIMIVIAFAFASMARTEVFSTLAFKESVENKFIAEGGIARGIVELVYRDKHRSDALTEEIAESWKIDGTPHEVEVGKGLCRIRLVSESGKVDINAVSEIVLRNLITNLGIKGRDGEEPDAIVDAILDWKDGDDLVRLNGAEDAYYQSLPAPYAPKNANLESVEELLLVKGVSPAVLYGNGEKKGLFDFVTVYSGSGQINANAAPREVLMAVPGMTEDVADSIISFRETREIKTPQDLSEVLGGLASTMQAYLSYDAGTAFTIQAEGISPGKKAGHAIRAIVKNENNKYKYIYYKNPEEIRQWKEQ